MKNNIITLNTANGVRDELINIGLENLIHVPFGYFDVLGKDLSSIAGEINDDAKYFLPYLAVANFSHLTDKLYSLRSSEHAKRKNVWFGQDYVVKSAKKGALHSFFDGENPHQMKFDKHQIAAEMVFAHKLSKKDTDGRGYKLELDVVVPIVMIKDLREGKGNNHHYFVERRFENIPNEQVLKPEHFTSRRKYDLVMDALNEFDYRTEKKGFLYVPVDSQKPFADKVLRKKKDGSYRVLATDCPHFEKLN